MPAGSDHPGRARLLAAVALICLAALAAYAEKPLHPFQFDDEVFILAEPSIRSLDNLPAMFTSGSHLLYRPLRQALSALIVSVAGLNAFAYHAVGLALHLLCCLALIPLGRMLLGSPRAGLIAALLAALHPARVDRVANITGSLDLLALALALWGLAFWARSLWDAERGAARRGLAYLLFLAGLLAGEEAAVPVLLAGVLAWTHQDRAKAERPALLQQLELTLPLVLLLAAYLALRTLVLGQLGRAEVAQDGPLPLWSFGAYLWSYVRLLLLPVRLSVAYPEQPLALDDARALIGWSLLLAALTAWLLWFKSQRTAGLLLIWLLLALAPFSQLLPSGTPFAERYLYHAVAPACLAAGWALDRLISRRASRAIGLACLALIALSFGLGTSFRQQAWRGPAELWSDAALKQPGSYLARLNYGNWLRDSGDPRAAIEQFQAAVALNPLDPRARVNLGNLLYQDGRVEQAAQQFQAALEADHLTPGALVGLANVAVSQGRFNRALELVAPLLRRDPDDLAALMVLGYISAVKGEYSLSIEVYQRVIELSDDPGQIRSAGRNIEALKARQQARP